MGLKIKVEDKEGIPRDQQCLIAKHEELDNDHTLDFVYPGSLRSRFKVAR